MAAPSLTFVLTLFLGFTMTLAQLPPRSAASKLTQPQDLLAPDASAFVIASSVADLKERYSDHLLDGNPNTYWQASSSKLPQWVEVRWPNEQLVSQVRLHPANGTVLKRWRVTARVLGQWQEVTAVGASNLATFDAVETRELRIWIDETDGGAASLSSLDVAGQRRLRLESYRPYWKGVYIWYDEPDKIVHLNVPRYFRQTFHLDDPSAITDAIVQSRSNDHYRAYVNGAEVAFGNTRIVPTDVRKHLRVGENVLAYEAIAHGNPGWARMELIGELTLVTPDGVRHVSTDPTWRASTQAAAGWNEPGFREGDDWRPVFVLFAPPAGFWGKIVYHVRGQKIPAELRSFTVSPASSKPGQTITLSAEVVVPQELSRDFLFEFRIADDPHEVERVDFHVASVAVDPKTSGWNPGQVQTVSTTLTLPEWAPAGELPVTLAALAMDVSGAELVFQGRAPSTPIVIEGAPPAVVDLVPAKADQRGTVATFKLADGQVRPAVFVGGSHRYSFDKLHAYADAGVKTYEAFVYPYRVEGPDHDYRKPHFEYLDQLVTGILRKVPDAAIIVCADIRPSARWLAANPQGRMIDAFGNVLNECVLSTRYQADIRDYVGKLADFIAAQPYKDRVIGYRFMLGAQQDAYIGGVNANIGKTNRDEWTIGDFNPDTVAAFRRFLRDRYGNDEAALRGAWKDQAVTFDTASADPRAIVAVRPDHNLFRDPTAGRMGADYAEFLSGIIPIGIEQTGAAAIRQRLGKDVFVACWSGYFSALIRALQPAAAQQNNGFWLAHNNYQGDIDVFTGTTQYHTRAGGYRLEAFQPFVSQAMNGKMAIIELDHRTFVAEPKEHGRMLSQEQTSAVMRRDMGTALLNGGGYYFWDFSSREGRSSMGYFNEESVLADMKACYGLFDRLANGPRVPQRIAEVALVLSAESTWHQDVAYPAVVYENLVEHTMFKQLARIGAPVDLVNVNDLDKPDVRSRYKLFLLLNPFYLSAKQRADIEALKGNGRTLAFFYAPGYVSDEHGLSVDAISSLTGLPVKLIAGREKPAMRTADPSVHPLLSNLSAGTEITIRPLTSGTKLNQIAPETIHPNFEIAEADGVVALGRDDAGRVRLAAREHADWKSVYLTVPYAPETLLHNLVVWSGVHRYTPQGLVVEGNDRYLLIHHDGKQAVDATVQLRRPARVRAYFADREMPGDGKSFRLQLPAEISTEIYELTPIE